MAPPNIILCNHEVQVLKHSECLFHISKITQFIWIFLLTYAPSHGQGKPAGFVWQELLSEHMAQDMLAIGVYPDQNASWSNLIWVYNKCNYILCRCAGWFLQALMPWHAFLQSKNICLNNLLNLLFLFFPSFVTTWGECKAVRKYLTRWLCTFYYFINTPLMFN